MAIAGRVAIVPKGDWSADAAYKRLDAVTYNNTLYFAKKEVPAGTATSNTEYWSKSIVGGAGGVATADEAGVVKPADGLTVAEDGTLKVSIDGTTLTMDQVNNVIKLADTLKDKINGAFPAANLINNLTTTEAGFGLDARQGKALDDKITEINGSLNNDISALNPSGAIRSYVDHNLGEVGDGWYRFAEITFTTQTIAEGAMCHCIEILIMQMYNNNPGCFHKVSLYLIYNDQAKMIVVGQNANVLRKVREVRKNNIIYLDVYSRGIINESKLSLHIPFMTYIASAKCVKPYLVPETSDGEVIVCSVDLANNI